MNRSEIKLLVAWSVVIALVGLGNEPLQVIGFLMALFLIVPTLYELF